MSDVQKLSAVSVRLVLRDEVVGHWRVYFCVRVERSVVNLCKSSESAVFKCVHSYFLHK